MKIFINIIWDAEKIHLKFQLLTININRYDILVLGSGGCGQTAFIKDMMKKFPESVINDIMDRDGLKHINIFPSKVIDCKTKIYFIYSIPFYQLCSLYYRCIADQQIKKINLNTICFQKINSLDKLFEKIEKHNKDIFGIISHYTLFKKHFKNIMFIKHKCISEEKYTKYKNKYSKAYKILTY